MEELKLLVPTYYGATYGDPELFKDKQEWDEPRVPMLMREADGVRIVLGTHDYADSDKPDVQIERRPNGWAIFLHPVGGGDPSGIVYFLDDGRNFLVPEGLVENQIEVLGSHEKVPLIDDPPLGSVDPDRDRFPARPKLSAAFRQASRAIRGEFNDAEHDALVALMDALNDVDVAMRKSSQESELAPLIIAREDDQS